MEIYKKQQLKFTALVLAGGFGTRLLNVLGGLPKPLAPICGKPFLYWLLLYIRNSGAERVILLTHYEARQINDFVQSLNQKNFKVECLEEAEPLGTGGAILAAVASIFDLPDNFVVFNGDSLVMCDIREAIESVENGASAAIVAVHCENTSRFGTLTVDKNGDLIDFHEKNTGVGYINTGVYVFSKNNIKKYKGTGSTISMEKDIFPSMLKDASKIKVVRTTAEFIDIGTVSSLSQASAYVSKHFKEAKINKR